MPSKTISFVEDSAVVGDDDGMEIEEEEEVNPPDGDGGVDKTGNSVVEPGPPAKRLKRDLAKEAEQEIPSYNELIENADVSSSVKFEKLSNYLESILENNVNTLQFETDFNEWTKEKLLSLIDEMSETSEEFYKFLCSVLKVTPTIVEGICEKILSFIYQHHSKKNNDELGNFMEKLSSTFEKLHRYPKLIAKLLLTVRGNVQKIVQSSTGTGESRKSKRRKSETSKTPEDIVALVLPKRFMNSFCSSLNLLPVGQIIDLWKTLDHNLAEECVKKIDTDKGDTHLSVFLSVVVNLMEAFLLNVKVADYSVPATIVEKVGEMMNKLKDFSLPELGKISVSSNNLNYIRPFLKLSYAWGTLHEFMMIYNAKYVMQLPDPKSTVQKAENLSYLFPYLSEDGWTSLFKFYRKQDDAITGHLLVSLVALKLKCLAVIDQQRREIMIGESSLSIELNDKGVNEGIKIITEENNTPQSVDNLKRSIETAAEFIWTHQHLFQKGVGVTTNDDDDFVRDILDLTSSYMDTEKLIKYAKTYMSRILSPGEVPQDAKVHGMHSITNVKFHVALILESLKEALEQMEKMKLMKGSLKKFSQDFMNPVCKKMILEEVDHNRKGTQGISPDLKKVIKLGLQIVNEAIKEKIGEEIDHRNHQSNEPEKLKKIIQFLDQQPLGRYPNIIKTVVFLNSCLMATGTMDHLEYQEITNSLISVFSECGQNAQGNEFLFQVNWTGLFELLTKSSKFMAESASKRMCTLILQNIYISPKLAKDFGDTNMKVISELLELGREFSDGSVGISALEFILQEVIDGRSKSTSLLKSHFKMLANVAVSKLSDGSIIAELHSFVHAMKKLRKKGSSGGTSESETKMSDSSSLISFVSRAMQTCYLLLKGKSLMNVEDAEKYSVIVLPYMHCALDLLEVGKSRKRKTGGYEKDNENLLTVPLFNCLQFLIEGLQMFEEFRAKLTQDFLPRLWQSCTAVKVRAGTGADAFNSSYKEAGSYDANFIRKGRNRSCQKGILKLILEVANEDEFQTICDSTVQEMGNDTELSLVAHILNNLIDAEIKADDGNVKKKQIRRNTIELSLHKCLERVQLWRESEDNFISESMPYVHFQTGLLRRRKPMCSLNSLAVCLSSVTAVPLDKCKDVETFKTVFLSVGDLLNALALHRIDVLSFRTHIFLQCFQSLVESLVKRADQRNKLTDREIYDLRQCGHCLERICQSTKVGKQEFSRVSPYLIVVMLQQFDKFTVYPVVKNPLLSGCYKLLDMCDAHGISHVNSMLSKGSREVFKAVYDIYNKFYRYKGKV